jgi:hypothetical protein
MYLFTRMTRLAPGHMVDGIDWALSVTEKVNQITSLKVGLWSPILSPGVGSLSWGAAVESLSDLEDADAKLGADPGFLDLISQGATITAPMLDDMTAQYVYNPAPDLDATHVAVVQSQLANGAFQRGVEVGVKIAEKATEIGGSPTAFLMAVTGAYAGCLWITGATSLRELETGEQAVNANADFLALLDQEAAACYLPGVTTQSIWRRMG